MAAKSSNAMNQQGVSGLVTWDGTSVESTIANVATGQVLISEGTGTLPAFSATPSVTSITLSGGSALSTYSTGSWTPALSFGGGTTGITYSAQVGDYTKIGTLVFTTCHITLSSKGSSTGVASISGLPYTSIGHQQGGFIFAIGGMSFPASCTYLAGYNGGSVTTIAMYGVGSSTLTQLLDTNFTNTANFIINLSYQASS